MDKIFKRYKVDYAAAYRHYIDFGGGKTLEKFCKDYAFMFSALESCDINHLSPESYFKGLITGLHDKKVEKRQLLPCYIRL